MNPPNKKQQDSQPDGVTADQADQADQTFSQAHRVRKQGEFAAVFASGVFVSDAVLVINALRRTDGYLRLGLSISRKVGNAVVRNRWKRLIREAFRTNKQRLAGGWDLVVRPKRGASPDRFQIEQSLLSLVQRLKQRAKRTGSRSN